MTLENYTLPAEEWALLLYEAFREKYPEWTKDATFKINLLDSDGLLFHTITYGP